MNELIKLGICVMAMSANLQVVRMKMLKALEMKMKTLRVVEEMENVNSTYTRCNISVIRDKETGVEYLLVNDDEITRKTEMVMSSILRNDTRVYHKGE